MEDVETSIPAFSMWRMFANAIDNIHTESSIKKLVNIVKSQECPQIFVYSHNPALSFEEYQTMVKRYETFSVWLLGRFFYLLSCDHLSTTHEILIEAQLRILYKISITQVGVYQRITAEYSSVLNQLNSYQGSEMSLKAFIPQLNIAELNLKQVFVEINSQDSCEKMLKHTLRFVEEILSQSISWVVSDEILNNVDSLIVIVKSGNLEFKLAVLRILVNLLGCTKSASGLRERLSRFFPYLQRLVLEIYNGNLKVGESHSKLFNEILLEFLQFEGNSAERVATTQISDFIVTKLLSDSNFNFDENLVTIVANKCSLEISVNLIIEKQLIFLFPAVKKKILIELEVSYSNNISDVSATWRKLYREIDFQEEINCGNPCPLENYFQLLNSSLEMILQLKAQHPNCYFFPDWTLLFKILSSFANHNCGITTQTLQKLFVIFPVSCPQPSFDLFFELIGLPLITKKFQLFNDIPSVEQQQTLKKVYQKISQQETIPESFKILCELIRHISSGLCVGTISEPMQEMLFKICQHVLENCDVDTQRILVWNLPHLMKINEKFAALLSAIFGREALQKSLIEVLPTVVCVLNSSCDKKVAYDGQLLRIELECQFCSKNSFEGLSNNNASANNGVLRYVLGLIEEDFGEDLLELILVLPKLSAHVLSFHSPEVTLKWLVLLENGDKKVRTLFAEVLLSIIQFAQRHETLTKEYKEELLQTCFDAIKATAKKSLENYDFDLQNTILETLKHMGELQSEAVLLPTIKILLFFVMIPISKYPLIAVNIFIETAKNHGLSNSYVYGKYKRELCRDIAEFCAINQSLINYDLATSLLKISLVLGFCEPKHFISQDCEYLLTYLVPLIVEMPNVKKLIEEMAGLMQLETSELLSRNYGSVFSHLFLNEDENVVKAVLEYVEASTKMTGTALRKGKLQVILQELLLNFHDNKNHVVEALRLLALDDQDQEDQVPIPDYLQPRFLAVLTFFDKKLVTRQSSNRKVLLSLTELFKFMGAKHVTPLRFKIIAMLRTALNLDCEGFPELNCNVWDAFIRNCEIEALAPQLATIFVSILPLARQFPEKISGIFRYLIVENEVHFRDHIKDLFFASEIDDEIQTIVTKYVKRFENESLKDHLQVFLKYITHETIDVRVYALRYIKKLLEKHREKLDQMILGYNGIDPVIVDLIDILTVCSRGKERALKIACGECIGELGAIEPSHLPRRCAPEADSFTFFMTEDAFLINGLNELIRALQAEKNTQNMNRVSLAIQAVLKTFGISPEIDSARKNIWRKFPTAQKEIMLPLLSSRYILEQPMEVPCVSPIYGSDCGGTYQLWIYNWMCSLISLTQFDKRPFLEECLPSMKQDHRVLMHFLPHILLHALVETNAGQFQKIYQEFIAVVDSHNLGADFDLNSSIKCSSFIKTNSSVNASEDGKQNQCTKMIFVLFDFLERWVLEWEWQKTPNREDEDSYRKIKAFVAMFNKLQLAKCNYHCKEHPRALMYLEDHVTSNPEELKENFSFLTEVYAQLDEPDGVSGVADLQPNEPSLEERLLSLQVSGKLSDAAACYERLSPPLKMKHLQGLMQCYLDLDNVTTALNFIKGAVDCQPDYTSTLLEFQAEPFWRLGQYEDLDDLLGRQELRNNDSWGVQIGKALLHFRNDRSDDFKSVLDSLRIQQVEFLGTASLQESAYQHGYDHIARLHIITELEQAEKTMEELRMFSTDPDSYGQIVGRLTTEWDLRLKVVQESIKIQEQILCVRRVVVGAICEKVPRAVPQLNSVLGECWLTSAKFARAAGVHQQAYSYTLKAEEYAPPRLFLEKAKLFWLREEYDAAFTTLRRGLEKFPKTELTLEQKKICAEAQLLTASYNDSISNVDTTVNTQHFKEAVETYCEWEKSLVCLAQYYDRMFQTLSEKDKGHGSNIQLYMINYFGKSLLYGTTFIYQSMPRMLSIWFDYGTRLLEVKDQALKVERKEMLGKMTTLIERFVTRLPTFIFLTAFSQLVSRICHPQPQVYETLKSIIIKLILQYPQQSMWMILAVVKSGYSVRSKRCAEILKDPRLSNNPGISKLIGDFTNLAEKLIELCNKGIPDNINTSTVSSLVRGLPRLLSEEGFSQIMVPTQKFRKLILPNPDFQTSQHNPFPNYYVHIVGIAENVAILQSLQRPRKIAFKGSDGKKYIQMLKPKDDLRKDFRLMEFNDIVNQLLNREAEARQRRLNIRLYSVVPLNEECGLIEWVPDLVGLRAVVLALYKQKNIVVRNRELKAMAPNQRDTLAKKRDVFVNRMLPLHPPVLSEWFRKTFPDAHAWFTARTAYTRTTAVISIVGYVLGLGDRHGENILLDSTCGDTVHVDFNCLFNKGESFEWPERVPFRLTHNMVAAMGPLGVEGFFRKACACTLRVLRTNSTTLMSIVTPFVYDPLVSWSKSGAPSKAHSEEWTNEKAVEHVKDIEVRLKGQMATKGRSFSIPLSVEGQTNKLIQEAMSVENLCQMYVGWGAYL